ncbi:hypothetical protein CMI39_01750 [Candidatus Pacearchaeota archaeon]|nr:hypothetical protein [Candidatus Pacearchaeota archaeon]
MVKKNKIKQNRKVIIVIAVIIIAIFLIKFNIKEVEPVVEPVVEAPDPPASPTPSPVKYFSESTDKIEMNVGSQILYTDNPTTTLSYFALDDSNNLVSFKDGDRAFVRILGITHLFTENTEIFHPGSDNTIFIGDINISFPGVYLIKICLGPSINLDSEGNMVWPFGCFEDQTSIQMNVYEK